MYWKPVVGMEGRYEVSNEGNVRSIRRGTILKGYIAEKGYVMVCLYPTPTKRVTRRVHVIVAAAFIGPRPPGLEIDHIDEDKQNNAVYNLRYVTPKVNTHKRGNYDRSMARIAREIKMNPKSVLI
jgi:hypothetical protein